ncbi:hypothetical protein CI610_00024 [invertebrate metagenome]|uniref:Toluene tolerance protein n=1 Tax=invertebrate metagenome TaxID=1711999 RepID=A0A2H9TCJ1_9ZZZZ
MGLLRKEGDRTQCLSEQQFYQLREGAMVIEKDGYGEKVLHLPDSSFLKLFRQRHFFSISRIFPYSLRFIRNTIQLSERGIPTVTVKGYYRIPSIRRTAVQYQPLPGETLRKVFLSIDKPEEQTGLLQRVAHFVALLHRKGVYFRSLHMGNILVQPDGELGLIDIADMRCYRHSLSESFRLRNFRHMARYRSDAELLLKNSLFSATYASLTDLEADKIDHVMETTKSR